jgi:hypothetical protein
VFGYSSSLNSALLRCPVDEAVETGDGTTSPNGAKSDAAGDDDSTWGSPSAKGLLSGRFGSRNVLTKVDSAKEHQVCMALVVVRACVLLGYNCFLHKFILTFLFEVNYLGSSFDVSNDHGGGIERASVRLCV